MIIAPFSTAGTRPVKADQKATSVTAGARTADGDSYDGRQPAASPPSPVRMSSDPCSRKGEPAPGSVYARRGHLVSIPAALLTE